MSKLDPADALDLPLGIPDGDGLLHDMAELYDPNNLVIDVRSPAEYAYGHVAGAHSIPLFDNDERAQVGTTYKQVSREAAIKLGLEIVGPKLTKYVDELEALLLRSKSERAHDAHPAESNGATPNIIVHCWRGGMRSNSMAWLFRTAGYTVRTVDGGYKAYRRWVLDGLERPWKFIVIGGRTGSRKTLLLRELQQRGHQVVDLERISNHKGSAFGALQQPPQPSSEHAMNLVHRELSGMDAQRTVFVEDESLRVGTVVIHKEMFDHMQAAPLIVLDIPRAERAEFLADDYGDASREELRESFIRITKRLGGSRLKDALAALDAGDLKTAADIALDYYDQAYDHAISRRSPEQVSRIDCSGRTLEEMATLIEDVAAHLADT